MSRLRRDSRRRICASTVTSSAVVGSSRISSGGSQASAAAISARCFIPPDSWCGKARATSAARSIPISLQRDLGAAQRLGERQPEMLHHRLGDLPADAQRRVERRERILEDGADPPSEHAPPLRRRETGEVLALEQDGAGDLRRGAEKVQDGAGDAALAGPGFADDGERPARLEREADIAHGGDLPLALAIADREIADLEQRFGAAPSSAAAELWVEHLAQAVADQADAR